MLRDPGPQRDRTNKRTSVRLIADKIERKKSIFYYLMMIVGAAAISFGFYSVGEGKRVGLLPGIAALFLGFLVTFSGLLLAFAPGFFS